MKELGSKAAFLVMASHLLVYVTTINAFPNAVEADRLAHQYEQDYYDELNDEQKAAYAWMDAKTINAVLQFCYFVLHTQFVGCVPNVCWSAGDPGRNNDMALRCQNCCVSQLAYFVWISVGTSWSRF